MWLRSGLACLLLLVVGAPNAFADDHGGYGGGADTNTTGADSDFSSLGDLVATIDAASPGDVVEGSNGTFAFPVNVTVYGKPQVQTADRDDYEEACFYMTYGTSPVDSVESRQEDADRAFSITYNEFIDIASSWHAADLAAYEERLEENEQRIADGEEPLPALPLPEPPPLPMPACEGSPATAPDFTAAFDAAAEILRNVERADPYIAPGRGITGLEGYLETRRELSVIEAETTFPDLGNDYSDDPLNPTPISGTVSFRGQGQWSVDWGDGTVEGPFETPGVAYGDDSGPAITHTYLSTGEFDITVTDQWRVSMVVEFLGESYVFTESAELEASTTTFPVTEVRSNRDR